MVDPERAPVAPHVIAPDGGDAVPLDETFWSLCEATRGAVEIRGGTGSGKTTALRHLAASMPAERNVALLDEPEPTRAETGSRTQLVIYTATSAFVGFPVERYRLAPWTSDDLIAYLRSL